MVGKGSRPLTRGALGSFRLVEGLNAALAKPAPLPRKAALRHIRIRQGHSGAPDPQPAPRSTTAAAGARPWAATPQALEAAARGAHEHAPSSRPRRRREGHERPWPTTPRTRARTFIKY